MYSISPTAAIVRRVDRRLRSCEKEKEREAGKRDYVRFHLRVCVRARTSVCVYIFFREEG